VPGRGLDQHETRGGTRARQRIEGVVDARAPSGDHRSVSRLVAWILDPHVSPIAFQFFGDDLGERRAHALPHFGLGHVNRHGAIWRDGERGIRLKRSVRGCLARPRGVRDAEGEREAGQGGDQELPPIEAGGHRGPLWAALRIARLMRG
jgi:hypothetical protein